MVSSGLLSRFFRHGTESTEPSVYPDPFWPKLLSGMEFQASSTFPPYYQCVQELMLFPSLLLQQLEASCFVLCSVAFCLL